MISNPARIIIGNTEHEYRFSDPGSIAYHFSPNDNGLSPTMEWNIILFADDETHALQMLSKLFEWMDTIYCKKAEDYAKAEAYRRYPGNLASEWKRLKKLKQALSDGQIRMTLAPTDQVYKVGWASNDVL